MAKKKSSSKENKMQTTERSSRSAKPTGRPPIWTSQLAEEYTFCCSVIAKQLRFMIAAETDEPPGNNPTRIIPYVRALVCLIRAHPYWPRHFKFVKEDIAKWRKIIEANLVKSQKKFPEPYRQEFVREVMNDLEFLDEFMNRKRNLSDDI